MLRNEIWAPGAALELLRRARVKFNQRRQRARVDQLFSQHVQLQPEFQALAPGVLLKHFRQRRKPSFFTGLECAETSNAALERKLFPEQTEQLLEAARLITRSHRWPLMGFGEKDFGKEIDWNRDPLSGRNWPLDFHADIQAWHNDGSDIRVLWELNRLGHLLTLGRAYAQTENEEFAEEVFLQLHSWREQNPPGRGANWACAMEVALRATNLLATLAFFHRSPALTEERLLKLLLMLEQHGAHISRNLEFSYVATGNHYIADVVGLLWLGIMLPELSVAAEWRDWALREMLREMDKQVTADGADYESSTSYHRLVLELFLYSFLLCRHNEVTIPQRYWQRLKLMLYYVQGYLRPDGSAPLIGDTDGAQVLPIVRRTANDHGYLLALGSIVFKDPKLKPAEMRPPEEVLWILGEPAVRDYGDVTIDPNAGKSVAFPEAGTYVLRHDDLYLLFNASGAGGNGRNSHGHNDSLSIEVFACGRPFIVDPGSFVYTANLQERHLFRSTAYHSTVQVDAIEQNSTYDRVPFVIGDEAHPRVTWWESDTNHDLVMAEHYGYKRLSTAVTHRRKIIFDKRARWWLIEDEVDGSGEHVIKVRFHFDSGLEVGTKSTSIVAARDKTSGARLFVCSLDVQADPELETTYVSRDYGSKQPSVSACWAIKVRGPGRFRWALVPVCSDEDELERMKFVHSYNDSMLTEP